MLSLFFHMFFSQKKLGRPYLANPQFGCSDPREKKGFGGPPVDIG